ncbi:MAG: serine hydrolase domain-containing protein [Gemmatimonadota bacterium]|nr:serine hydrolase domain-containing protein [Gemmatimonadota bacterium]
MDLDAPVTEHLVDAPDAWRRLTLRHLLTMTSGLPGVGDLRRSLGPDPAQSEILAELYRRHPEPRPGEGWEYGNADFFVVQAVLERAGGVGFQERMRREVLEPAGMTSAAYWRSHREVLPGAATGYYPDSTVTPRLYVQREFSFPTYQQAAGGLAASVEDLLRFDAALRDGRLLPDSLLTEMWADVDLPDGRIVSYGLGWDTKTHAPGERSAGHSGGYLTTFRVYPGSDLTVIALMNGLLRPVSPDVVASAFAAVWDPSILGLERRPCDVEALEGARF